MLSPFGNGEEFLDIFKLGDHTNYESPVILTDRRVGFSVQRKYPDDIRYKPPKNSNGEDDVVALTHVIYEHPDESGAPFDPNRVPTIVRIVPFSRYRAQHIDYDFKDPGSPTEESLRASKRGPKPLEIDYLDEFFFNHISGNFVNASGKEMSGVTLLELVYQSHCDTVRPLRGIRVRTKVRAKSAAIASISWLVDVLRATLNLCFGRILDEGSKTSAFLLGYKRDSLKKLSTDSLNIFGYQAAKNIIVVFSLLVVAAYCIKYFLGMTSAYASKIFSNNFLALTHSMVILWLLDVVCPNFLFAVINALIKLRTNLMFRRIRVRLRDRSGR